MKPILLAEDSDELAERIQRSFHTAGIFNRIIPVADGLAAIVYLRGDREFGDRDRFPLPGVLLLDLRMPRLDGFDVLEWLNTEPRFADLLVVVLSGHESLKDIKHAYSLGADAFLSKHCHVEELVGLMERFPGYWKRTAE